MIMAFKPYIHSGRDWGLAILNMLIICFCIAMPPLIFLYLIVVLNMGNGRGPRA